MFEAILFSCILSGMPVEVPDHLAEMALPDTSIISGTTYYLAQNVENASDLNDGLSPSYEGKNHGPWKTLNGPRNLQLQLLPGDAIEFHEGVYLLDSTVWSLPFPFVGTKDDPIRFYAFEGDQVIIDGQFNLAAFYKKCAKS